MKIIGINVVKIEVKDRAGYGLRIKLELDEEYGEYKVYGLDILSGESHLTLAKHLEGLAESLKKETR